MAARPSRPQATKLHQNPTLGNHVTERKYIIRTNGKSAKNTEKKTLSTVENQKTVRTKERDIESNNDNNKKNSAVHCIKKDTDSETKVKNGTGQNPSPEKYDVKNIEEKRSGGKGNEVKAAVKSKVNARLHTVNKAKYGGNTSTNDGVEVTSSKTVQRDAKPQAKLTGQNVESEMRSWQKGSSNQQSRKPIAPVPVSKFSKDVKSSTKMLQAKEKESFKEMIVVPKATRIQDKTVHRKSCNREATVMAINMKGRYDKNGSVLERRRHIIYNVINKYTPTMILFQDFDLPDINSKFWTKAPLPDGYLYIGNETASIMYDQSSITAQDIPITEFQNTLEGLHRHPNNKLKQTVPSDFDPLPRMCTRVVTINQEKLQFICVSWNGKFDKGHGIRMKHTQKLQYFEFLMEFLRIVKEKVKLPILIAGNFNVDMYSIEHLVKPPFHLCIYDASMRRTVPGIVDYFIVTDELSLNDITWVSLREDTTAYQPNGVMDHDPVRALLSGKVGKGSISKGMTNPNKWNSAKTK